MSPPPTAGPKRIARYRLVALRRIALGRRSGPTMSYTISCEAGRPITPAAPWINKITAACQMRRVPVMNSTAHASEASANSPCEIWMSLRQSKRSARAPA